MNIEPEKIYSALSDIFSEDNINNYLKSHLQIQTSKTA
jgi:hypothetical protein